MSFRTLNEIPDDYKELIEQLIERGIIVVNSGKFEYPLNPDILYLVKIMQRMI